MTWWITQPGRAQSERIGLADLAEAATWLGNVRWRLESELRLAADLDIHHSGEAFPLTLIYPPYFPDVPPLVLPADGRLISGHQYGAGGELCLEFRADNWDPSITGAMMVESAYRLISGERDPANLTPVPSAHERNVGRELRGTKFRFLVSPQALRELHKLSVNQPTPAILTARSAGETCISAVRSIGDGEEPSWTDDMPMPGGWTRPATAIRLGERSLPEIVTLSHFAEALSILQAPDTLRSIEDSGESFHLVVLDDGRPRLFMFWDHEGQRRVDEDDVVLIPEDQGRRTHPEHQALAGMRIGIVGCGSLGSKIAASLARSGVANFLLVDHDVFFPGNLVRNELDWRAVGLHKVDALRARLRRITQHCKVTTRRVELGGQESAGTTASVMKDLSECDLIIDATADARVFNLCAAVARRHRKPLVWAEVFAGGIGGIVARTRPDLDPPPHLARRQISEWCDTMGVPVTVTPIEAYATVDNGAPLVADDADVSVIAAHATRLIIDTICRPTSSIFPQSAYAIGHAAKWLFSAPFDTFPIAYTLEGTWGAIVEEGASDKALEFLEELLPVKKDENPSAS